MKQKTINSELFANADGSMTIIRQRDKISDPIPFGTNLLGSLWPDKMFSHTFL